MPDTVSAMAWSAANVTPLPIDTVTRVSSPSSISSDPDETLNVALSLSATVTTAEADPPGV